MVRTVIIWSILHYRHHSVEPEALDEAGLDSVINGLFPGITYSTTSAFSALIQAWVKPVLEKLFPDLLKLSENDVHGDEEVMISPFLKMDRDRRWDDPATIEEFYQRLDDFE